MDHTGDVTGEVDVTPGLLGQRVGSMREVPVAPSARFIGSAGAGWLHLPV